MIRNQEEDEFVAVRVQDPRIQSEGSWNSYVDYKIFLHTNSKAFTAKTSCVRRRYSEFAWLKKKLQKNTGLVPVPDLPGKSFFSFSNEDFLERRRKGLQAFLDRVVHMTVCLSDSQLHLFLQTQLPVGHIQDCVQGHTPYSVTDAILTYASSNLGFAQAQEDDPIKEPSLTVSYESMESPAPHQPFPQTITTLNPVTSDPLEGLLELRDEVVAQSQHEERPTIRILQKNNQLEAVVEHCNPTEATFFLGESRDDEASENPGEQSQQSICRIQTPVEVHSPMGTSCAATEEDLTASDTIEEQSDYSEVANVEKVSCDSPKTCENTHDSKEPSFDQHAESVREDAGSENQVVENQVTAEVNGLEHVDVTCPEEPEENTGGQRETVMARSDDEAEIHEELESAVHKQADQELDPVGTGHKEDSDEDDGSLPSSNESIIKVSDEESICSESEDLMEAADGLMQTPPVEVTDFLDVEASSRSILDLQMNGCPVEKDLQYKADIKDLSSSLDLNCSENGDFSILETISAPESADGKHTEPGTPTSLSLDTRGDS